MRWEKNSTASAIVPTTNTPSIQRYGPTSYRPIARAKPIAANRSVATPPSARSSTTIADMSPSRPGCRRALSKMRDASPPTALGSTWPAV